MTRRKWLSGATLTRLPSTPRQASILSALAAVLPASSKRVFFGAYETSQDRSMRKSDPTKLVVSK